MKHIEQLRAYLMEMQDSDRKTELLAGLQLLKNADQCAQELVWAYEYGEIVNGGTVEWEHLDSAYAAGLDALGEDRVKELQQELEEYAAEEDAEDEQP